MAEPESSNVVNEVLKYLGYVFVGVLSMFLVWVSKLIGDAAKEKIKNWFASIDRLEKTTDKLESAIGKIDKLEANDVEIKKRLDEMQTEIHAIKTHLNL